MLRLGVLTGVDSLWTKKKKKKKTISSEGVGNGRQSYFLTVNIPVTEWQSKEFNSSLAEQTPTHTYQAKQASRDSFTSTLMTRETPFRSVDLLDFLLLLLDYV